MAKVSTGIRCSNSSSILETVETEPGTADSVIRGAPTSNFQGWPGTPRLQQPGLPFLPDAIVDGRAKKEREEAAAATSFPAPLVCLKVNTYPHPPHMLTWQLGASEDKAIVCSFNYNEAPS